MAPAINEAASAKALTPGAQPWKWIQEIIKNFIVKITNSEKEWMIFIDTNPSFSIYTQIAISAAQRLLTPINADDSSKTAVFRSNAKDVLSMQKWRRNKEFKYQRFIY